MSKGWIGERRRGAIEQAVARGYGSDRIVEVTGEDPDVVQRVLAEMDQRAADLESA